MNFCDNSVFLGIKPQVLKKKELVLAGFELISHETTMPTDRQPPWAKFYYTNPHAGDLR